MLMHILKSIWEVLIAISVAKSAKYNSTPQSFWY